ncbi:MAG: MBOAT family protein, partial [Desulfuromonadales bacterium]|nr:MBOAT family protein [Desulfuromonadales bacterium]
MLFNSYEFLLAYLPVTLAVYLLFNRLRLTTAASAWLLAASLFFYAWWDVAFLPLILGSILFNYTAGSLLVESDRLKKRLVSKKVILFCAIGGNLVLLGYFKYADFFLGSLNAALGTDLPLLRIILPLGISFFTITQIAFLIDAYEGLVEERKLLNYALFVTFFPHLLAGPILHHKEMMPQFDRVRNKVLNYRNLSLGLLIFFLGLFKKVVIADPFSTIARAGFDGTQVLTLAEAWVTSLSYTLQLYFDFSGYSDMAVGLGLMFNIRLPVNFNSPYKALNIIDFWKRWHITLTTFITTYVYTPILRTFRRVTFAKSLVAVFLAMFISGIWHGAGWTFVIWGALHGGALVVNHIWRRRKWKMPVVVAWLLTFNFVNIAFVFFRAGSWDDALRVLQGMFGFSGVEFGRNWLAGIQASDESAVWLGVALVLA